MTKERQYKECIKKVVEQMNTYFINDYWEGEPQDIVDDIFNVLAMKLPEEDFDEIEAIYKKDRNMHNL